MLSDVVFIMLIEKWKQEGKREGERGGEQMHFAKQVVMEVAHITYQSCATCNNFW